MKKRKLALVCLLYVGSIISTTVNAAGPSQEAIDTAIRKSIPLLETAAAGSSVGSPVVQESRGAQIKPHSRVVGLSIYQRQVG